MNEIHIIDYFPVYKQAFKILNETWIRKYFELEEEDIKTLGNPDQILIEGGFIFVAILNSQAVGVCALKKTSDDTFEFSKMAVAENVQGKGIGNKLGEAAIAKAKLVGAKRIFLEGNTSLEASIHLYRKLGFKEVAGQLPHYRRVNIILEMFL